MHLYWGPQPGLLPASLSWRKEGVALLPWADPGRGVAVGASLSNEEPPCSQDRGLAALRLTSLIRWHVASREGVLSGADQVDVVITPRRRASCHGQVRDRVAGIWDSAEVRGRRSGAPRCAFPWGDHGTAWGSGKPLWAGCSCSVALQEG